MSSTYTIVMEMDLDGDVVEVHPIYGEVGADVTTQHLDAETQVQEFGADVEVLDVSSDTSVEEIDADVEEQP